MTDVLFVAGFLTGDEMRDVGRLADRLSRRGISSRLLCAGGARGLEGTIEVPGLLDRWRRAWQLRRLEPPASAVTLLHGLGIETAEAVLDLAERWQRPYVLTIEDYLVPDSPLRLSRRWCRGLIVPSTRGGTSSAGRSTSSNCGGMPTERVKSSATSVEGTIKPRHQRRLSRSGLSGTR
jgi:hypothetical protein